ncbi:hypothetical protein NQF86_02710 [Bombella sp. TMW 2.2543]|uniref:Uncharacterized protein n=1 Tax=Bombella pluederhausensis TaxID=2967336 RepID=A0ABT3WEP3_9PROT|nr:hypothetical protein [Bombella pluederhausensis]MCX5617585.1 hypothetical protein [Bombella pluederhausensis]
MKPLHWLRQPTTLQGLSLIIAGLSGAVTGGIDANLASTLLIAAVPLLLPDNSTARTVASAAIPPVVEALEKNAAAGKEPHKPG